MTLRCAAKGEETCAVSCWMVRAGLEECPPRTPGLPDPALVVGQWRDPAESTPRRLVLPQYPDDDMPVELHPDAMWLLPDDTSLEDAYALLSAAVRRIWRECLDARDRWAHSDRDGAVPRAVAYQYVAGQLHRAIDGATAIHQPKGHP